MKDGRTRRDGRSELVVNVGQQMRLPPSFDDEVKLCLSGGRRRRRGGKNSVVAQPLSENYEILNNWIFCVKEKNGSRTVHLHDVHVLGHIPIIICL